MNIPEASETVFEFEKRHFRWQMENVAAGMVGTLVESPDLSSSHTPQLHGRNVNLQTRPDMDGRRFYWVTEFRPYKPKGNAKKPKPGRPGLKKWGTAPDLGAARQAAFEAYIAQRYTKDEVE